MVYCKHISEAKSIENILVSIQGISILQQHILQERYLRILRNFKYRCIQYSLLYYMGHFIITVGSLIVPALMSVQYTDAGTDTGDGHTEFQTNIYWITWFISLMVTASNAILALFKIDKKYFFLHTITERLRSEGWQYFSLTGRYSGMATPQFLIADHENQFIYFCHQVEKIKMKQIEEEYYKQQDDSKKDAQQQAYIQSQINNGNGISTTVKRAENGIYPLSPDKPIMQTSHTYVPDIVTDAVRSIINANASMRELIPDKYTLQKIPTNNAETLESALKTIPETKLQNSDSDSVITESSVNVIVES